MAIDAIPTRRGAAAARRSVQPIQIAAAIGIALCCFELYLLVTWIAGPNLVHVAPGPSVPPTWMKLAVRIAEVASVALAAALIHRFVVRPWRRQRHIPFDGLLVLTALATSVYDPLSSYFHPWFTYNAEFLNLGTPMVHVPGWQSFHAPGQQIAWPILFIPPLYVYFFWLACVMGSWVMRRMAARWPGAGKPTLIGGCFLVILAFDFVLEGLIWMPGGAWTLAGGHIPVLFPDTYHQFTINEWFPVSMTLTAVACIRHFRDDRGRTIAERGIEELQGTPRRKLALRILAITGAVHVAMFACYVAPNFVFGLHVNEWPKDVQKRSYFTDYICGQGTDRACPGPAVPNVRNDNAGGGDGTARITPAGELWLPRGETLPRPVPFER